MHPRLQIVHEPTPLVRAVQLSQQLQVDLWIKRDDLAGLTFGGNKSRQLEYYIGAAQAAKADTVLITGAVQSNFVRLTAAVARAVGMHPIVQLEDRVPGTSASYARSGNVILSRILGAEIMHYARGEDEAGADQALYARAEALRQEGRTPYVIPLGADHPPLGALGYVNGAHEILAQQSDFDMFVVGSGSGATHAGLLAGLRGGGSAAQVIGSCVRRDKEQQTTRIAAITRRLRALYAGADQVSDADIVLWDGALAPGYGQIGPQALDAMKRMAQSEGVMLDPVYTAKAFAAIPALVADGTIPKGSRVCFVHTGGLAGLFAYEDVLGESFL